MRSPDASLHVIVADAFVRLGPKQQRVARFLAGNEAVVAFTPATELAARLDVDPATVVRLTKVLGFDGYPDLQRFLRARFPHHYPTVEQSLNGDGASVHQRAFRQDAENLRLGIELLDEAAFEQAVQLICRARRTLIFGGGVAAGVVTFLGSSLRSMGFSVVQATNDGPPLVQELVLLTPEDVAFGIGFYRYVGQTVSTLRRAGAHGIPRIALTDSLLSPLVPIADHVLCAPVESISHRVSLVAPMAVCNALIAACAQRRPEQVGGALRRLEQEYHAAGLLTDE